MVAVLAFALAPWVCAQPSGLEQALSQALHAAVRDPGQVDHLDRCLALLEPWRSKTWDDAYWGSGVTYAWTACHFLRERALGRPIDQAEVLATLQPWLEHARELDPRQRSQSDELYRVTTLLHRLGLQEAGNRYLLERVDRMLDENPDPLAEWLSELGASMYGRWQYQEGNRAVAVLIERRLGASHPVYLQMLRALSYHERYLGRPREALVLSSKALDIALAQTVPDGDVLALLRSVHASNLAALGRLSEARSAALQVRRFYVAQDPMPHERLARVEYNLSNFALAMADPLAARAHADSAVVHALAVGSYSMAMEARYASVLGDRARLQLGDETAADRLIEAIRELYNHEMHLGPHAVGLVAHLAQQGDHRRLGDAVWLADEHLRIFGVPMQPNAALRPLMQAWLHGGWLLKDPGVRPDLLRALALSLSGQSSSVLVLTQFSMARHLAGTDPAQSIWWYKRAANELQKLRGGLPDGDPGLHRSWLNEYEGDLRRFVALLIDAGRFPEAEQALAVLRDEEAFDYMRRRAPMEGARPLSFTAAEQFRNAALATVERDAARAAKSAGQRADGSLGQLFGHYEDAQADADLLDLTRQLQALAENAPPAALTSVPQPVRPRPAVGLPPGVVRIAYLIHDQGLDILVHTHQGHWREHVAVSGKTLNELVFAARAALATPQHDARPALQALWRFLIAPVAGRLPAAGELRVTPDAVLRYVPFAALHDGARYLVERYSLRLQTDEPSNVSRSVPGPLRIAAFGRSTGDADHSALPGVADELRALARRGAMVKAEQEFDGASLAAALRRHPDVVHLASHFRLDPGSDEASYLLLGDGSHLSVAELAQLPWRGVGLALLSACDSATPRGPGREWLGLASALQRAGVRQVLATLWRVGDEATAEWVKAFYATSGDALLNPRRVADVQRDWLRRHRADSWAHPHYWAAFTWLGGA